MNTLVSVALPSSPGLPEAMLQGCSTTERRT